MVKFGTFTLPHVLLVQIVKARQEIERIVPGRNVAYHADKADLGQTFRIDGEIRTDTVDDLRGQIEQIRELNNGVAESFDLEDGTTPAFNALLTDPEYQFRVAGWLANTVGSGSGDFHVPYSVSFLEVA